MELAVGVDEMDLLGRDKGLFQIDAVQRGRAEEISKNGQHSQDHDQESADDRDLGAAEAAPDQLKIALIDLVHDKLPCGLPRYEWFHHS